MSFDDSRWTGLLGGYRVPYDPRNALRALERDEKRDETWKELWNELYHQGDVDGASYAAVPHLVRIHELMRVPDWNTYALATTVEQARHNGHNPELPSWLRNSYEAAWRQLIELGFRDLRNAKESTLICSIFAALAMGKGQTALSHMSMLTEDEREAILNKMGWG
jgi:hypothetical protein